MKKFLIVVAFSLCGLALVSCQKVKYCQCSAFINNEDVALGEDYYMIERGTCNDKAKEIVGWGTVTCKEVKVEDEEGWLWNLFHQNNNNNNNNNNHNKP